jgi:AbrB family looped-hinge helix DNA binding protein
MPSSTQASRAEPIESSSDSPWPPSTVAGPLTAHTRINANGRIVIPAAMREKLGLLKDDSIVMEVEDGVLRIESYLSRIRRIQAEFAHLAPVGGLLASDALIMERRQEAQLENEALERARELRRIRDGFGTPESHTGRAAAPIQKAPAEETKLA